MEKKYFYIVSLKHTSNADTALTFWGPAGSGYTWHKDRAGLYAEDVVNKYTSDDNVAVEESICNRFWIEANDFSDKYISVPNIEPVLHALGLNKKFMKPARMKTCEMIFVPYGLTQL